MIHKYTEKELVGKTFGELLVIRQVENDKHQRTQFECLCSCEKIVIFRGSLLATGRRIDCGHLGKERVIKSNMSKRGSNNYYEKEDYIVGISSNTQEEFFIDKDDFDKVKDYTWREKDGYIETSFKNIGEKKKRISLHSLILNNNDKTKEIDHINKNKKDNRKNNLRLVSHSDNMKNRKRNYSNKTGVSGVEKRKNKYMAVLKLDGIRYNLGIYENIDDAIVARLKAEKEYFGEFAPQRHLFEEYGI